jgi:ABC-type taurine transport system substrate-binding protein
MSVKNNLKQYGELIENLAFHNESMIYFNSGPEHAAIVFSKIFKYANEEINIVAGNMNGGISSQEVYLKELEDYLKRKGKIKILLEEFNREKNPDFFNLLSKYQFFDSSQIILKKFNGEVVNTETRRKIHFCIADEKIYRVEEDVDKYVAKGSFNDSSTVDILKNIFEDISSNAEPILLN